MDELEKFEASLCTKCEECRGSRQYKLRGKGRVWCKLCGGSGLERTVNPGGGNRWYVTASIHNPAPYKYCTPNE